MQTPLVVPQSCEPNSKMMEEMDHDAAGLLQTLGLWRRTAATATQQPNIPSTFVLRDTSHETVSCVNGSWNMMQHFGVLHFILLNSL